MKSPLLLTSLAVLLVALPLTRAQAPTPEATPAAETASPAQIEFKALFDKISAKLKAGQHSEAEFTDEIKAFDPIIAKATPEEAAMITLMKARLYLEVFAAPAQAVPILKEIKAKYPATEIGARIDSVIASIEAKVAAEATLAVGAIFPNLTENDTDGKSLDLGAYQGKIVLVDFWATWCGPCIAELPNVLAAYEKYHAKGFEIIGISLDKDRAKLDAFIKEKNMTWRQYFDGLGWENKVSTRYGIDSIPATFLLDGDRRIIAKGLRGEKLDQKLATLLK